MSPLGCHCLEFVAISKRHIVSFKEFIPAGIVNIKATTKRVVVQISLFYVLNYCAFSLLWLFLVQLKPCVIVFSLKK